MHRPRDATPALEQELVERSRFAHAVGTGSRAGIWCGAGDVAECDFARFAGWGRRADDRPISAVPALRQGRRIALAYRHARFGSRAGDAHQFDGAGFGVGGALLAPGFAVPAQGEGERAGAVVVGADRGAGSGGEARDVVQLHLGRAFRERQRVGLLEPGFTEAFVPAGGEGGAGDRVGADHDAGGRRGAGDRRGRPFDWGHHRFPDGAVPEMGHALGRLLVVTDREAHAFREAGD